MEHTVTTKKTKTKGRCFSHLSVFFVVLMLGVFSAPQKAHAVWWVVCLVPGVCYGVDGDAATIQGDENTSIINFLSGATKLVLEANALWLKQTNLWVTEFEKYSEETKLFGAATVDAFELYTKTNRKLADSIKDTQIVNTRMKAKLDYEAKHYTSDSSYEYICLNGVAYGAVPHLRNFARALSGQLLRGFSNAYRTAKSDGNGPQKSGDAQKLKCGDFGPSGTAPKTGSTISGHECVEGDTDFADLDVSAEALEYGHVYTAPEKVQKGQAWAYKNTGDKSTRMWLAVRNYCYNFGGSRPSPLHGKNIRSDTTGQDVHYATCLARQNTFAKACFDRLAKISRPNPADNDTKTFFDLSKEGCLAAKSAGVALPKNVDCEKGTSLYQAELLTHELCNTSEHAVQSAKGGIKQSLIMKAKLWCTLNYDVWKKRLREEDESLTQAVLGMNSVDSCW